MNRWYRGLSLAVSFAILATLVLVVAAPAPAPPPPPPQPVTVTNTPLPVSPVGTARVQIAPQEPVWAGDSSFFSDGCCEALDLYVVPDGKRLFVEYVSAGAVLPAGQTVFGAVTFGGRFHGLVFAPQGSDVVGKDHFRAGDALRSFANAGETVQVILNKSSDSGSWVMNASLSGYLVDV